MRARRARILTATTRGLAALRRGFLVLDALIGSGEDGSATAWAARSAAWLVVSTSERSAAGLQPGGPTQPPPSGSAGGRYAPATVAAAGLTYALAGRLGQAEAVAFAARCGAAALTPARRLAAARRARRLRRSLWRHDSPASGAGRVPVGARAQRGARSPGGMSETPRGQSSGLSRLGLARWRKWFKVGHRGSHPGGFAIFFGEYEHTIDDKNRLTLGAVPRALAEGVVSRRASTAASRSSPVPPGRDASKPDWLHSTRSPARPRVMERFFFAGPPRGLDKDGRVLVPGALLAGCGARPGRRRRGRPRPPRDLGPRHLVEHLRAVEGERGSHVAERLAKKRIDPPRVPVLADEVRGSSPCSRARRSSTPPSVPEGTPGYSPKN